MWRARTSRREVWAWVWLGSQALPPPPVTPPCTDAPAVSRASCPLQLPCLREQYNAHEGERESSSILNTNNTKVSD